MGNGTFLISKGTTVPKCHTFTNLEVLPTVSFWFYMGASLHWHSWLNHWQLGLELNIQPLFPPCRLSEWHWKLKSSNHRVRFHGTSPIFRLPSACPTITQQNKRHFCGSQHLGIPKGFSSLVSEMETKTKYNFLL